MPAGQTLALVGTTGAGKTTIAKLVARFHDPDAGRITLDGVDITTMSRAELRSRTGMVLQDTWLFSGTIGDNIAYGRPGATREQVRAAAEATYVDRFVHSLPDGYDTHLDDEGGNISAGEKQLLTIARAFLADPSLLILDEATSSVDTRTERLVQQAMAALRANWEGQASDTQAQTQQQWEDGAEKMKTSLEALRKIAENAHKNYTDAVDKNTQMWAG